MRQDNKIIDQRIQLPFKLKKSVLAFGSQLKNTVCFAQGSTALISRVHDDLSHPEDFLKFRETTAHFLKKGPQLFAVDMHPEYQSTKYALSIAAGKKISPVQHHHAHLVSCLVENLARDKKAIGVAFDGTGFGESGRLWGAEFLVFGYKNFTRQAHLKEIPLAGGERAIQEPWRLSAAWLDQCSIKLPGYIDKKKWVILKKAIEKNINSPLASSMGRLFDAAASIIFSKPGAGFEAELAIRLEKSAVKTKGKPCAYGFEIKKEGQEYIIDPKKVFQGIIRDLKAGSGREMIALKFHQSVASMVVLVCSKLAARTGIKTIVLSGGVFQNRLLHNLARRSLEARGFLVLAPKALSPNDSGISLGQALAAKGAF